MNHTKWIQIAMHRFLNSLWQIQHKLPRRISRIIYKSLRRRGFAPETSFTTDFYGLRYEGKLSNNIDFAIYYFGAFEKPLLYFMRDSLLAIAGRNGIFVDVGANIGQHSLFMSQYARHVIAFEPYAQVRTRMEYHIRLNAIGNIELHAEGLSDISGKSTFYAPTGHNEGVGSFDASTREKGNLAIGEYELIRGDDHFTANPPDSLHLLKVDVEGLEKPALAGLQCTLQLYRPVLVCELTYRKPLSFRSKAEILDLLPDNYELFCLDRRYPDGRKSRRRTGKARQSGHYALVEYPGVLEYGQDDIIACPREHLEKLPRKN
jgi:FkbM family methyltransferase